MGIYALALLHFFTAVSAEKKKQRTTFKYLRGLAFRNTTQNLFPDRTDFMIQKPVRKPALIETVRGERVSSRV